MCTYKTCKRESSSSSSSITINIRQSSSSIIINDNHRHQSPSTTTIIVINHHQQRQSSPSITINNDNHCLSSFSPSVFFSVPDAKQHYNNQFNFLDKIDSTYLSSILYKLMPLSLELTTSGHVGLP